MSRLADKFESLSLRQRFLLAPVLGLILLGMLMAAFIYESQRQNELLVRVAARDLAAFDSYSAVFVNLSAQHIGLQNLLRNARKVDAGTLYDNAKIRLYAIHDAVNLIEMAMPAESGSRENEAEFRKKREEVLALIQDYRRTITAAVDLTTLDAALAPARNALANERFIAMNAAFANLLNMQRREISSEVTAGVRRSQSMSTSFAVIGISIAALLLILSVALAHFVSRSLESEIDELSQLEGQARDARSAKTGNEVERISRAIAKFKRTQTELRESEERYRQLVDLSPDAIFISSGERIVFVNSACMRLLGAAVPADLIGKQVFEITHPDFHGGLRERQRQLREGKRLPSPSVQKKLRLDGTAVDVEVMAAPLTFDGHMATQVVMRDITERVRAEEALARFAAIVDGSRDAIVSRSLDRIIVTWNAAAERLFGYDAAEVVGRHFSLIVPPDREQEAAEKRELIKDGVQIPPYDSVRVTKDGRRIDVSISQSPINDARGKMVGVSLVFRDITERKRAEELLARTNAELEKFVLVASHDLQEPLRTTANAAMLLEHSHAGKLDGDAKELLGFVVSGVMHMRRLIDSLLVFAGIGAKPAVAAATDCQAVVTDVLSHLRAVIGSSGAVVDCGPLPIVRIDPARLDQVFMNLISNAVKFRGAAPLRIRIEAHRDKSDWVISVADNGIGIDPKYFGKIFEIFERLNARYAGTGVGLAICKKIVEDNNGRIWVESEEGKGTTFYFTVAAVDVNKEAECPTVQSL